MARPSTFVVAIEFTAGAWTDVTAYHDYHEPTTIKRGRNSVLDVAQPGTCSLVLLNNDGRFTPAVSWSPYWPNIRPNVRIRVTVNSSIRFTGYIDDWIPVYPSDTDDESRVQINATDRFRLLSRHTLDSTYVETVRSLEPTASVWQWDAAGRSCPDILGNASPTNLLSFKGAQYGGSVGSVTYSEGGPTRVSSGVRLTPGTLVNTPAHNGYLITDDSSGDVIRMPASLNMGLNYGSWTLGFWAKIDTMYDRNAASGVTLQYGTTLAGCDAGDEWSLWLESNDGDGALVKMTDNSGGFFASSSPYFYNVKGVWRYWTVVWNGTILRVYLDGVSILTGNPAAAVTLNPRVSIMGFAYPLTGRCWNHPDATVAAVTYSPTAVSAAHVLEFYNASATGFAGETTYSRAVRLFSVGDVAPGEYLADYGPTAHYGSAQATHGPFDTGGKDVLALGQEIAQAERGLFVVAPDGTVRMADRYARAMSSTPAAVFDQEADTSGTDYSAPLRDAQIVNRVTVSTVNGGSSTANDDTSQTLNGVLTSSVSLGLNDSDQGGDYAYWMVSQFATAKPRIAQVTIDLLTSGTGGIYATAFALGLGARIEVTGLPLASSESSIFQGFVEGMTEVYSTNEVTLTLDTSSVAPGELVLDDDVLGRLTTNGETTAGMTAVATTCSVSANPGFYWTGADLPYDIQIGSEQMTVTAGTAPSPDQVLTVTRGVNGTYAHAHYYGDEVTIVGDIVLGY